jgi:hypothetical protein
MRVLLALIPYWVRQFFSDWRGHLKALTEVGLTALFTLSPFIIAYFVRTTKGPTSFNATFMDLFGRGQLYLLAYGIFGTVFWLAFIRWDQPRHGVRAFLGCVATLMMLPIVGFIGVDPTFSTVANRQTVMWGYYFYAGMLLINYLLLFYMDKQPPAVRDILRRGSDQLSDEYRSLEASE